MQPQIWRIAGSENPRFFFGSDVELFAQIGLTLRAFGSKRRVAAKIRRMNHVDRVAVGLRQREKPPAEGEHFRGLAFSDPVPGEHKRANLAGRETKPSALAAAAALECSEIDPWNRHARAWG